MVAEEIWVYLTIIFHLLQPLFTSQLSSSDRGGIEKDPISTVSFFWGFHF
jgi:hypothetical protein